MGTFGTPSSYNNTGALGGATNPTTAQGLSRDRENQKAILELPGTQAWVEKTITDGVIIPTSAEVIVLPEGGAPTDSLTTIALTSDGTTTLHEGMPIRLKAANSNTITVVHGTGTNNISTIDGNNVVLDTTWYLELKLINSLWVQQETNAYRIANTAGVTATDAQTLASGAYILSGTSSTSSSVADKVVDLSGYVLRAGSSISVTFSNANTVADAVTLNVNGTGAKAVYNQTGIISTSNTALFAANQPIEFRYDGTGWVFYDAAKLLTDSDSAVSGSSSNLKVSATGTNANVSCTADEVIVKDSNNKYLTLRSLNLSASITSSGANGLDAGSVAASSWYYVHVIHNPTTNTSGLLLSLSSGAPTLPVGYTFWARIGAIRTDGTANKYPIGYTQRGSSVSWLVHNTTYYPIMAYGPIGSISAASVSLVGVSVSAFVPPTAETIKGIMVCKNSSPSLMALGPSAAFTGGYESVTHPPVANWFPGNALLCYPFEILLESTNIYAAIAASTGYIYCVGWEDNL